MLGTIAFSLGSAVGKTDQPDRNAPGMSGTTGTKESGASLNPPNSPYHSYGSIFSGPVATGSSGAAHNGGCPVGAVPGPGTESAGATSGGCAPGQSGTTAMPRSGKAR